MRRGQGFRPNAPIKPRQRDIDAKADILYNFLPEEAMEFARTAFV
jgi:hypothetical protein